MGAAKLNKTQLNKVVHIEAWAYEMKVKHTRECTEKICGGKSKMWWVVRHPSVSREIANPEARKFVATGYHVCEILLERLESGSVPWLPRERATYAKRSDARILRLLGRVQTPEQGDEAPTPAELSDPFPGVRESFPETRTEQRQRAWLAAKQRREARAPLPVSARQSGPPTDMMAQNGLAGIVGALTRRR